MNRLLQKYSALPRAGKWLTWTIAIVAVYFGIVEPVLVLTNESRARADTLAQGIQRERALTSADSEQGAILERGRRSFGEPYLPEDARSKPELLHAVVDSILKARHVDNSTIGERKVRISGEEASQLLGPLATGMNCERVTLDIAFEASPEVVTAVLSDLEAAKEVTAISRVEIRRQDAGRDPKSSSSSGSRIVKATISPEAWVMVPLSAGSNVGGLR